MTILSLLKFFFVNSHTPFSNILVNANSLFKVYISLDLIASIKWTASSFFKPQCDPILLFPLFWFPIVQFPTAYSVGHLHQDHSGKPVKIADSWTTFRIQLEQGLLVGDHNSIVSFLFSNITLTQLGLARHLLKYYIAWLPFPCADSSNEDRCVVQEYQEGTLKGKECSFSFPVSLAASLEVNIMVRVQDPVWVTRRLCGWKLGT